MGHLFSVSHVNAEKGDDGHFSEPSRFGNTFKIAAKLLISEVIQKFVNDFWTPQTPCQPNITVESAHPLGSNTPDFEPWHTSMT